MAVIPQDFYDSVVSTLNSDSEIERRNAASRVYYALYHQVVLDLNVHEKSLDNKGIHESVIRGLMNSGDKALVKLAYKLKGSKNIRVEADYYLEKEFTPAHIKTLLENHKGINQLIVEYRQQLQA